MVQGIPYVHWKIKDAVDLTEIDPVYLWGTVIETDKGPTDTPVFCTNAEQVKKIFNYDLNPFFVNGGTLWDYTSNQEIFLFKRYPPLKPT